jgi:ubiquinone/menaquinone biosynthesis C-methylase UbiE
MTNNFVNNGNKAIEMERYESRARFHLDGNKTQPKPFGAKSIPTYLRSPYLFYEEKIKELIRPQMRVLEIGSGMGLHTYSLIKTGAHIIATDISPNSLQILEIKIKEVEGEVETIVADMEKLPFQDGLFDVVTSAGSLSYGDAKIVDKEIRRVLKPDGLFICVDSLNNNPIYRLNRYIHFLKGNRSKMTLKNMPSIKRVNALKRLYSNVEVNYFGSIAFLMPIMKSIVGGKTAKRISDSFDKLIHVNKSAFKFVLVAKI